MFEVIWHPDITEDLAALWLASTPDSRMAITVASQELDKRLASNPQSEGESRSEDHRITIIRPLIARFRVDVPAQKVFVVQVRLIKPRSK